MKNIDNARYIETKNWIIYKMNNEHHRHKYEISKNLLAAICDYEPGFPNISDWVVALCGKNWASKRMVLKLCDIIKRIKPNNTINWCDTYRYIDSIFEGMKMGETLINKTDT